MKADENAQQDTESMDLKMLDWTVPRECPIQNYVDSNNVFHQRVDRVDLGSLNWTYDSSNQHFYSDTYSQIKQDKIWRYDVYCSKYIAANTGDKRIGIYGGRFYVWDSSYTDSLLLKQDLQGVYAYYELAKEITTPIDGNEIISLMNNKLGGLTFSASGKTLSITDGTNTWTLEANS